MLVVWLLLSHFSFLDSREGTVMISFLRYCLLTCHTPSEGKFYLKHKSELVLRRKHQTFATLEQEKRSYFIKGSSLPRHEIMNGKGLLSWGCSPMKEHVRRWKHGLIKNRKTEGRILFFFPLIKSHRGFRCTFTLCQPNLLLNILSSILQYNIPCWHFWYCSLVNYSIDFYWILVLA